MTFVISKIWHSDIFLFSGQQVFTSKFVFKSQYDNNKVIQILLAKQLSEQRGNYSSSANVDITKSINY
jgi:hypothetical protein